MSTVPTPMDRFFNKLRNLATSFTTKEQIQSNMTEEEAEELQNIIVTKALSNCSRWMKDKPALVEVREDGSDREVYADRYYAVIMPLTEVPVIDETRQAQVRVTDTFIWDGGQLTPFHPLDPWTIDNTSCVVYKA